ncbi:HNH endonuclease signature motif containing protein [Leifsonia sp. Root60]|uniref:HNH endonuclease signature motif containing protein n=2 Tax=unclassified Leifsonia TaxID=2663824 RepID=UPI00138F7759|nr:HNH endonuclease signature motif containing protein [Leifsonia sp. Root60]
MSDSGLVRVVDALSALARAVGALQALVAGEVARRSRPELGPAGLAKGQGFSSPADLLAASAGASLGEAKALITVGEATAGRESFTGERMPSPHPFVQAALTAGRISVAGAAMITRMLDRVACRAHPELLMATEEALTAAAAQLSLGSLSVAVKYAEARLDTDGVQPREEELHAGRSLSIVEEKSGAVRLTGVFAPVDGAVVAAAINALVSTELRRARDAFGSGRAYTCPDGTPTDACVCVDPALTEQRTLTQMRADALADIARHVIGCEQTTIDATTAVVVRMDLEDLTDPDSAGVASIDGIAQPISAETARGLAASAGIIPLVLGGDSAPLDLGRSQRLFTRAQKIALAERDGGCAFPGCARPPQFCDAHHIRWWDRHHGPTDITNGILLCSHHHHLIHREGWGIQVAENRTWFTPPVHIDPGQRPRPGNNLRRLLMRPVVVSAGENDASAAGAVGIAGERAA